MENITLLVIVFLGLFLLFLFTGWLIAFCLAGVAIISYLFLEAGTLATFAFLNYNSLTSYSLLALPIFILMGELLISGEVAPKLYDAVTPLMERFRGGLIYTNILANTILGAACGSTIAATTSTSTVAIPELKRRGYQKEIVYGSLASAGCLAALIPPSVGLIVYAAITDTSIGQLFIAGIIPGLILSASLVLVSKIVLKIRPQIAPPVKKEGIVPVGRALFHMVKRLWPLFILIGLVLGTIYTGVATATESATFGVAGAMLLGIKNFTLKKLKDGLFLTVRICVGLFLILAMASIYGFALNAVGVKDFLLEALRAAPGGEYGQIYLIWFIMLFLGMFLEPGSGMIITTPIFLPFVVGLGYDPIWYGIWLILAVELGNITPPVGLTLYAVQAVSGDKLETVAKGCLPYWAAFFIAMTPITFFPAIALWLPRMAF